MVFLKPDERKLLEAISKINYVNPFLPERVQCEREALGDDFDESKADWNLLGDDPDLHLVNINKIIEFRAHLFVEASIHGNRPRKIF